MLSPWCSCDRLFMLLYVYVLFAELVRLKRLSSSSVGKTSKPGDVTHNPLTVRTLLWYFLLEVPLTIRGLCFSLLARRFTPHRRQASNCSAVKSNLPKPCEASRTYSRPRHQVAPLPVQQVRAGRRSWTAVASRTAQMRTLLSPSLRKMKLRYVWTERKKWKVVKLLKRSR